MSDIKKTKQDIHQGLKALLRFALLDCSRFHLQKELADISLKRDTVKTR